MRRVADRLGVGTMSLYRYVPGKAELLDVMVDQVCGATERQEEPRGGWRPRLDGPYDPGHAFEFGLERLLDGIAAFVERRTGRPRPSSPPSASRA